MWEDETSVRFAYALHGNVFLCICCQQGIYLFQAIIR